MDTIPVIVSADEIKADAKGGIFNRTDRALIIPLSAEELQAGIQKIQSTVMSVLDNLPVTSGYGLQKMEIGLEITAEGGFALIGTAKVGTSAAIKLIFERRNALPK